MREMELAMPTKATSCSCLLKKLSKQLEGAKQTIVSRSSTEAEYRGLAAVTADILWLQHLLRELRVPVALPRIYCDNLGVVHLAANPVMHSRTKHFELDLHFVRNKVLSRELVVVHLSAEFQVYHFGHVYMDKSTCDESLVQYDKE
ncbi:Retrovirus-related Pol polyprotein from transposon RE2 [Glycine soja]|uniref:Retrovirus-related Pol polyprotein from transposon RE2 n=1 Tax=Glycine soja TaxID=3848 RepID=A0A445LNR7_GLYSO|nr:Retrovirus-related Pol polyprotein from transposon RE2 [Glycine soja]